MFFNKKSKKIKQSKSVLELWINACLLMASADMNDSRKRKLILLYFIGSSDVVCQSNEIDDKDFVDITNELLFSAGFEKNEIWENMTQMVKTNLSKEEFDFMVSGGEDFLRWMRDGNKNAPLLLFNKLNIE